VEFVSQIVAAGLRNENAQHLQAHVQFRVNLCIQDGWE